MADKLIETLSKVLDEGLVTSLIENYRRMGKYYIDDDYDSTLAKSGLFIEDVFRILKFIKSKIVLPEIKSGMIKDISDELLKADGKKFPETIRIVIPNVAKMVYDLRSKLGAIHVKSIKPDYFDAKFVVGACEWIIIEFLRTYDSRTTVLTSSIQQESAKIDSSSLSKIIAGRIDTMKIPELILIAIRINQSQIKSELNKTIQNWGRDISKWLGGGNFNSRIVQKGLIRKTGKKINTEDIFELTIKGTLYADKIIENIKTTSRIGDES